MHEAKATTEVDELIGQRIRARRQELGLPMTHVAELLNLTQQALQKYETGEIRVSAAGLTRIADVLQIDAADLLPGARAGKGSPARKRTPTPDGMALQLQRAFERIQSPQERRLVLDLAKRFASSSPPPKKKSAKRKA